MEISISDFKRINPINIIDIRSSDKYNFGTIKNAINISENELLYNYEKYLNKSDTYYIFCQTGRSSKLICNILYSLGYKVYSLIGGYSKYVLEKK